MNWKRTSLFILACPMGAILGWSIIGLLVGNPIILVIHVATKTFALPVEYTDKLYSYVLSIAAAGGGAGFTLAGLKSGNVSKGRLADYFIAISLVIPWRNNENAMKGLLSIYFIVATIVTAFAEPNNIIFPIGFFIGGLIPLAIKNINVQQSGPAYPPQGVGSADP